VNLQSVFCGNGGASLNLPAAVGFVTCRHCGSALKVQHTESVAFTEVLETLKEQSSRIAQNTEALQIQNEIALPDLEWTSQSAELMVQGENGRGHVPVADFNPQCVCGGRRDTDHIIFYSVSCEFDDTRLKRDSRQKRPCLKHVDISVQSVSVVSTPLAISRANHGMTNEISNRKTSHKTTLKGCATGKRFAKQS
jgi:hypothetical protein